jgi:hypothetical protein
LIVVTIDVGLLYGFAALQPMHGGIRIGIGCLLPTAAILAVGAGGAAADIVWIDHSERPGRPGTETPGIVGGSYTSAGLAGDPAFNHVYLVRCVNESGRGPPSKRVGEFDFSLDTP